MLGQRVLKLSIGRQEGNLIHEEGREEISLAGQIVSLEYRGGQED